MNLRSLQNLSGTKKLAQKTVLLFGISCLFLMLLSINAPLGDFGNYYFGSLLYREGWDPVLIYKDTHLFNVLVRSHEKSPFFLNYVPVPPFSLTAYLPFTILKAHSAKLILNLLSILAGSAGLYFWLNRQRTIHITQLFLLAATLLPCYYNLYQGQTYLLLCGVLLLFYETLCRRQYIISGFFLAFAIALKLSPAWFILFLLFKKQFSVLIYSFMFLFLLHVPLFLGGHADVIGFYISEVLPKLIANEITDPLSVYNQSVHTIFLQADALPVSMQHGLSTFYYGSLILIYFLALINTNMHEGFVLSLLFWSVINKYVPAYSLVLLSPLLFYDWRLTGSPHLLRITLLIVAINLPVYKLTALPWVWQYTRVWLLLSVFFMFAFPFLKGQTLKILKWSPLLLGLALWSAFKATPLPEYPYAKKGFTRAVKPTGTGWLQYICLGYKDSITHDTFTAFSISRIPLHHHSRYSQQGYLVNDTVLFYLSDKGKGVGLPQLTFENIK